MKWIKLAGQKYYVFDKGTDWGCSYGGRGFKRPSHHAGFIGLHKDPNGTFDALFCIECGSERSILHNKDKKAMHKLFHDYLKRQHMTIKAFYKKTEMHQFKSEGGNKPCQMNY